MEENISDVLKYLLKAYPHKSEMSASRLTKIFYLADWKSALLLGKQISKVEWYFNRFGPYVDDFVELASRDRDIRVSDETTVFGGKKKLISLDSEFDGEISIGAQAKEVIDFVIKATEKKSYEDFLKLVYSTYPVQTTNKYSNLDLIKSARDYKLMLNNGNLSVDKEV